MDNEDQKRRQMGTAQSRTEVRLHLSRMHNACLSVMATLYGNMKEKSKQYINTDRYVSIFVQWESSAPGIYNKGMKCL